MSDSHPADEAYSAWVNGPGFVVQRSAMASQNRHSVSNAIRQAFCVGYDTAKAEGWRPIEEAPKDGKPVLITDGKIVVEGFWRSRNGKWAYFGGQFFMHDATHFQPLPKAKHE